MSTWCRTQLFDSVLLVRSPLADASRGLGAVGSQRGDLESLLLLQGDRTALERDIARPPRSWSMRRETM